MKRIIISDEEKNKILHMHESFKKESRIIKEDETDVVLTKQVQCFLKKKGYREVAMNWRIDPYEIDLIMIDKDQLVFVEVKTRSTDAYGNPLDAVKTLKGLFGM